jgi:hypothetical protein
MADFAISSFGAGALRQYGSGSYSDAAIPSLIVERISGLFNLYEISIGYGMVAAIATLITVITAKSDQEK